MMSQIKFYKYAALALLLLNIATLSFFWLTKPKAGHGPSVGGMNPPEILNLNKDQEIQFLEKAQEHQELMNSFSLQQRDILQKYFAEDKSDIRTNNVDELMIQFQAIEKEKIESVNQHFTDIKAILNTSQHTDFETFRKKALERILLPEKINRSRAKDF